MRNGEEWPTSIAVRAAVEAAERDMARDDDPTRSWHYSPVPTVPLAASKTRWSRPLWWGFVMMAGLAAIGLWWLLTVVYDGLGVAFGQ
jgi:hypothetical protein